MFKSNPSAFVYFQNSSSPQKSTKSTGGRSRSDGMNGLNLNSVTQNNHSDSGGNNGLKRTALMDSEEYVPPSKLPTLGHWEQPNTMNYGNPVFSNAGMSSTPVEDDDVELELVAEVAQTLHLDEQKQIPKVNPFRSGSKRKLDFAKLSIRDSEDDDEILESSKRTKMDWDDQNSKPGQGQQTLAITDSDHESREVFLSNEVQSLMSNMITPDTNTTPESIIIERIQKQNAMALVLWKPIQNIFEPSQSKVSYQNSPSKSETDTSSSDSDSSDDAESIIVEDPSGVAISNKMEEDEFDDL